MPASYAASLRRELCSRNADFALRHNLDHVPTYGREPAIVYAPKDNSHGNFLPASYKAILKNANWRARLNKVHTQGKTSLPKADRRWRELDSCVSSDALLMNIFCYPRVLRSGNIAAMLGVEQTSRPQFGYRPRVPLMNGHMDRTEVDVKIGNLLIEAKLTESDFQIQSAALVETYRDLEEVFDVERLPRTASSQTANPFPDYDSEPVFGDADLSGITSRRIATSHNVTKKEGTNTNARYVSYQLIRNVLAAHATGHTFCVMTDQRRPDLMERWHVIMSCIRFADLRTRCKVLTWQELSSELPAPLQDFLACKYGIDPVRTTLSSRY